VTRFLARRGIAFALTLWVVVSASFFLMRAVKGGPFDGERELPPAIEAALRAQYHLDWPLWKQYLQYLGPLNLDAHRATWLGGDGTNVLGGLACGDFGPSLRYRDLSVSEILGASLPISLALGCLALSWSVPAGIALGCASALRRGTRTDGVVRALATLGIAVPNFVLAGLLVLVFAFVWPILPPAGNGELRHLVLPSLALGAPVAAYVARLSRAGMLDALTQDWVRTARAKGLSERVIVVRHALRAGLMPVVAYLGPAAAGILTGSLVIERIFAIPGTGSHFVNGALNRDYTLAMGVTVVYTALVFGLNTLVDLAQAALDPRIASREDA
jgi:oligopeptide transport system permease protein